MVKTFEKVLFLRFMNIDEAVKIFENKIGESELKEMKGMTEKYPTMISSANLYKLLQIEKNLSSNSLQIKKSILTIGIIKLIEEIN